MSTDDFGCEQINQRAARARPAIRSWRAFGRVTKYEENSMGRRTKKDLPPQRFVINPAAHTKSSILRDLGRTADDSPVFSLPSRLLPWGVLIASGPLTLLLPALIREGPVGVLLSAALALAFFIVLVFPRKLIVGDDGLLVAWLGSRFIPYREIAYIETTDGIFFHHPGINIALKNGRAIDFTTSIFKERWAERDALISLIRVYADDATGKRPVNAPGPITRNGRSFAAWARALRAIGNGAHFDTRAAAVVPEDLLRVAESTHAAVVDRAAAFVALAATKDDDIVRRLRIACDHTVAPNARAALRGALETTDDDDEIGRVLEYAEHAASRE
jgi:hypothetical protein